MAGGARARSASTRLVACCTSAHPGNPQAWAERAAVVRAAGSTAPIVDGGRRALDHARRSRSSTRTSTDDLRAMLLASPASGYAECCGVLERLDLRDELAGIDVPTLVVGGAQDTALPPDHGERIAEAIPGARFELLDPAAHIPMVERPDVVAGLILEHLEVPV